MDRCCIVYTKPARAGEVKTRLIGALTAAEAADLHQAFLDDMIARLRRRSFDLRIAWALDGDHEAPPPSDIDGFRQQGEDLGARLFHGMSLVGRFYAKVAAVGSDHPELPSAALDEAFDRLDDHDIVIGPARDGGYYLIAAATTGLSRDVFTGIEWGSSRVLTQTLGRCTDLGLDVHLLAEGDDVDIPSDLDRLGRFLAAGDHDCPSTEQLLRRWGMLS